MQSVRVRASEFQQTRRFLGESRLGDVADVARDALVRSSKSLRSPFF